MVPDLSRTSLGLEYFLWEQDEEWEWPDERLIELGIKECNQIGLVNPREVVDGTVVRMKKAYPVYDQNYHDSVAILRQYVNSFQNLQTIGRNGLHRYNNQDHSMLTGVYSARNSLGATYDVWEVNTEKEYHEEAGTQSNVSSDRLVPTRIQTGVSEPQQTIDDVVEEALAGKMIEDVFARIDAFALGIALGFVAGFLLCLTTIILLLKGGDIIGPTLSLLGHYLPGYTVSWSGVLIGSLQIGAGGFIFGYLVGNLRNWSMSLYASIIKRREEANENRDLLGKV